jgi:hypothetical protein
MTSHAHLVGVLDAAHHRLGNNACKSKMDKK